MLDALRQDLRHAMRFVRRNPLFALTAVLSLAIGIGANTAIFTVVNALFLRSPAGVVEPDRLVDIGRSQDGGGFDNNSYPNFLDVRRRVTSLADVYAYCIDPRPMSLGGQEGAERVYGGIVSANYFKVLGTRPRLGRLFAGDEDDRGPGGSAVAVISHRLWRQRFAADPALAGRVVLLNGHPFAVVGVAEEGFRGTTVLSPDLWVPASMVGQALPRVGESLLTNRASAWLILGGRLRPGVSLAQSRAELATIGQALEREFPQDNVGRGLRVEPSTALPGNTGPVAAFLGLLTVVVGLVLAIACVNLAGVLLARATARRREIAVRLAIGARRRHLIRLLLTETLALFLVGGIVGLLLARGLTTLLARVMPSLPVPLDASLPLDGRVAAFTLALTLLSSVLAGIGPVLEAARTDVVSSMKAGSRRGTGRLRLRRALVVGQVALSLLLVVGAGLFLRALERAGAIDPGFDWRDVELTELDLSLAGHSRETGPVFARLLLERVRALPGVKAASLAAVLPLGGAGLGLGDLREPGVPGSGQGVAVDWNVVEPGYFATLQNVLMRGRDFSDRDQAGSPPVVIVNETAARRFFPGQDPIGRILEQVESPTEARRLTVIGVARDGKYRTLGEAPRAFVYVPVQQQYLPRLTIVTRVEPGRSAQADLRALVSSLDPNLPIVGARSLAEHASLGLLPQRIAATVFGSLGIVGLLLAAMGVYGVMAYDVARRTREIGVRVALGAGRRTVIGMVFREGLVLVGPGLLIGLALAAALSRLLGSLLFGVPPLDPVAFGGVAVLFLGVALTASIVPARRAAGIEPMAALRDE